MAAEVELRIIKQTQETLGTVIKKPALNEKLLKKPPFRFLHDIIANVVKSTGFMKGLYTTTELNSENIKDKDGKIAFLQKAIEVLAIVTGETLSVRPSKIVAGHEPERTNEFLQALAKAIIGRMDSTQAVQTVLGVAPKPTVKKEKSIEAVKKEKTNPEPVKKEKTSRDPVKNSKVVKTRPADRETIKNGSPGVDKSKTLVKASSKKEKQKSSSSSSKTSNESTNKTKDKSSPKQEQLQKKEDETKRPVVEPPAEEPAVDEVLPTAETVEQASTSDSPVARPSTVSKSKRKPTPAVASPETKPRPVITQTPSNESAAEIAQENPPPPRPTSSMRYVKSAIRSAKSARPTTARPAAPRIRNKNIVLDDESTRLTSAKEVPSVILDTQQNDEDEGFVVEDQLASQQEELISPILEGKTTEVTEEEQKGSLVKQMLETKKDLEGGSQQPQHKSSVEIDRSQMSNRPKDREVGSKEIEQLRSFIQTVSRSANPLGKMLDYLQEDVDGMQQELRTWRDERQRNVVDLRREEGVTESVLDPLRNQLEELEQTVQDQVDKINAMKATILHNDERIHRMLGRQYKIV